jgi:hypothetical protein
MVYAVSYCPLSRYEEFKKLGFDGMSKWKKNNLLEDINTTMSRFKKTDGW